jgi:hypothetical protein
MIHVYKGKESRAVQLYAVKVERRKYMEMSGQLHAGLL